MHIYRSINEPIRERLSWNELWRGQDQGLIICWEMGRKHALSDFDLANKAKRGDLGNRQVKRFNSSLLKPSFF
jgi:hypothetical protein